MWFICIVARHFYKMSPHIWHHAPHQSKPHAIDGIGWTLNTEHSRYVHVEYESSSYRRHAYVYAVTLSITFNIFKWATRCGEKNSLTSTKIWQTVNIPATSRLSAHTNKTPVQWVPLNGDTEKEGARICAVLLSIAFDCLFPIQTPLFLCRSFSAYFSQFHICYAGSSHTFSPARTTHIHARNHFPVLFVHGVRQPGRIIDIIVCLPCNHNQHIKYYHRWAPCKHCAKHLSTHTRMYCRRAWSVGPFFSRCTIENCKQIFEVIYTHFIRRIERCTKCSRQFAKKKNNENEFMNGRSFSNEIDFIALLLMMWLLLLLLRHNRSMQIL